MGSQLEVESIELMGGSKTIRESRASDTMVRVMINVPLQPENPGGWEAIYWPNVKPCRVATSDVPAIHALLQGSRVQQPWAVGRDPVGIA